MKRQLLAQPLLSGWLFFGLQEPDGSNMQYYMTLLEAIKEMVQRYGIKTLVVKEETTWYFFFIFESRLY